MATYKISIALKEARRAEGITWQEMCQHLQIGQSSLSYLENRKQQKYVLYLKYLATNGVDLNAVLKNTKGRISAGLKNERQMNKIRWQKLCKYAGMSQGALSWMEHREDTTFIEYLRYLIKKGVNVQEVFVS